MYVADINSIQEAKEARAEILAEIRRRGGTTEQLEWDLEDIEGRIAELS
jgi:hypothetical protein